MNINYKYPLYPWVKDWSQYYVYQWHLVEHGPPYYLNFNFGPASVRKTLEQIKRIDNVTRGIPKVILLCGWQQFVEGKVSWDVQFPSFATTDKSFIDDSIGPTANDAIRWLMTEAKKYNTQVSFHLDFALVQEHSNLWQEYFDLDLLCKDSNGKIKSYGYWEGRVNLQKEFDAGLFQRRMADFFNTFPEVLETGCVHNDWNCVEESPWHGYTVDDDVAALKRNIAWLRETYGVDTFGEQVAMGRTEYDYGIQPLALSFTSFQPRPNGANVSKIHIDHMKVPAYISCGGHGGEYEKDFCTPGYLLYSNDVLLFGGTNQGEFGYHYTNDENNPEYGNNLFRDLCYTTLPWYYLNRLLRVFYDINLQSVTFSENVKSFVDENGKVCITKDGHNIRQGNDIFIPELWKTSREIMAWSDDGYENKSWKLPEDWFEVTSVDLYNNKLEGISFRETLPVSDECLILSLDKRDGVIIVPRGANPNDTGELLPPSGTAEFVHTGAAKPNSAPGIADVKIIGGELGKEFELHQIIDVNAGDDTVCVSIYMIDEKHKKCQVILDVIDVYSNNRIGESKLLNNYENGIYVTYKITGHVRFRLTRFHYDHFGRGDGLNESGPPSVTDIFIDKV